MKKKLICMLLMLAVWLVLVVQVSLQRLNSPLKKILKLILLL